MTTHVHIDRIVLDGVDPGPGQLSRLQGAIEQELAHLLADSGAAPLRTAAVHTVTGGAIDLAGTPAPAELGRRIAQATYEGMERSAAPSSSRGSS